jgi:hypothetical protein
MYSQDRFRQQLSAKNRNEKLKESPKCDSKSCQNFPKDCFFNFRGKKTSFDLKFFD